VLADRGLSRDGPRAEGEALVICDPWIDRDYRRPKRVRAKKTKGPRPPRVFKTSAEDRAITALYRETLRAANRCINGPLVGDVGKKGVVHGAVYKGDRCRRCWDMKNGASS
jgi:hypothetical protein